MKVSQDQSEDRISGFKGKDNELDYSHKDITIRRKNNKKI
jgi:hypothetical protein